MGAEVDDVGRGKGVAAFLKVFKDLVPLGLQSEIILKPQDKLSS